MGNSNNRQGATSIADGFFINQMKRSPSLCSKEEDRPRELPLAFWHAASDDYKQNEQDKNST
jgi:hypothetical protein